MAEDRCAITGYTFLINSGAVSWSSKWQEIVSLSTTESKYVAATHSVKEVLWLCSLLTDIFSPFKNPMAMLCVTKRRVDSYYTVMTHVSK